MSKYRKKPVIIDAIQWNGNLHITPEVSDFLTEIPDYTYDGFDCSITISTLEGDMKARLGDYIIRGVKGEYYPCKPDIFEQTYEKVNEPA